MSPVGFDNTMLSLLFNPTCELPKTPEGKPLPMAVRRAEFLLETLGKQKKKIIIPTPAVAEILTALGPDHQRWLDIVARSRAFEIAPFDHKCAVELAYMNRDIFFKEDKKGRLESRQKIKIDRQILAVLRASNVEEIYTDDHGMAVRARLCGLNPVATKDLPIPDSERQLKIEFESHDEIPAIKEEQDETEQRSGKKTVDAVHTGTGHPANPA